MSTTTHTYREGNIVYNNIDDVTGELFNTIDTNVWYGDTPFDVLAIDPVDNIIFFEQFEPLDELNFTLRKRIYTNGVNCNWFGHGATGLNNYLRSPCSDHERVLNITEPIILLEDNGSNSVINITKPDITLKFVGGRFLFGQITGLKTSIVVENKLSNRMNYGRSSFFARLEKLNKKDFDIDWNELFIDDKLKEENSETFTKEDTKARRRPLTFTTHIFNFTIIRGTWDIDHAFSSWFFTYRNGYLMTDADIAALQANPSYVPVISSRFNSDTKNLQQLLNLKARTTTIEEGIYMIDPTNNLLNVEDPEDITPDRPFGGLTLRCWTDAKLILNGTLKAIPNDQGKTSVMRIEFCKGITIEGRGKIQGDLIEHLNNSGEGGMGIRVHSTSDLTIKDITVELCFGDCIFVSWNGRAPRSDSPITPLEESRRNQQRNHSFENVTINYGRRTGLVYELGNDVRVLNCDFFHNGTLRGTSTFSAVDIEPLGYRDTKIRYCRNFSFKGCVFIHNRNGLRAERCLNMIIDDNYFEDNGKDIELLECFGSSYDITGPDDLCFIGGLVNIIHNKSFNSGGFLYGTDRPSKVIVRDNYTQNTNTFIAGLFLDSTIIKNKIYNSSKIFNFLMAINTAVVENEFFHVNFKTTPSTEGLNDGVIMLFSATGTPLEYSPELRLIIQNFKFNNNIIHDLSGKVVRGSGTNGIQPLPNSTLRNNFLGYLPQFLEGYVEFKDNIFPKSRIILPHTSGYMNVGFTIHAGDPNLTILNHVGNLGDQKLLMVGDIVWDDVYKQEGICTQFGRMGVFDDWVKITRAELFAAYQDTTSPNPNEIHIKKNTLFYLVDASDNFMEARFTDIDIVINRGSYTPEFHIPPFPFPRYDITDVIFPPQKPANGIIISMGVNAKPIIQWQTKGVCNAGNRHALLSLNYTSAIGRTLFDESIGKEIIWDGTNWITDASVITVTL